MTVRISLTHKEARYLYAVITNFWDSTEMELTPEGAEKLRLKLDKARKRL